MRTMVSPFEIYPRTSHLKPIGFQTMAEWKGNVMGDCLSICTFQAARRRRLVERRLACSHKVADGAMGHT
ncbi:hypothetical protein BQ8482_110174 [Mesorhizobium delmotii]|uniref:Uncharacterized protein n=1 Tax=Mesorhizobium delmotii TaxID=1631247 RepID=A0A2P9AAU0_9HYPH|nr:hypothetical protein BQ8482_110174 [Mesorhizobium delmotii]